LRDAVRLALNGRTLAGSSLAFDGLEHFLLGLQPVIQSVTVLTSARQK
jgi:hypothetical protein